MKARRNGFGSAVAAPIGAAALVVVALVAVIGSAQAAPSKKNYGATVDLATAWTPPVTPATTNSATLRLTLANDQKSSQTIGSANFIAPPGVQVTGVELQSPPVPPNSTTSRSGWTAAPNGTSVVEFRATSNALTAGASVFADVDVSINASTCTNATWTVQVKQSNDFSGNGNDFIANAVTTNLRPLGTFEIDPIETVDEDDPSIHVPQIKTNVNEVVQVTAKDVCGDVYTNYGTSVGNTAVFDAEPNIPQRLVGAGDLSINWVNGIGSTTLNPKVVETGDTLVITDALTAPNQKISDTSNVFDVVQELCTSHDTTCELSNGRIRVSGSGPPVQPNAALPDPSLGFGFSSELAFKCPGDGSAVNAIGGAVVNINPRDYPTNAPVTVTVIYKKADTGNGPATSFPVCLSKDNGQTWGDGTAATPLAECTATPVAPCVSRKRVQGGDLSVAFFIRPTDPWGGAR